MPHFANKKKVQQPNAGWNVQQRENESKNALCVGFRKSQIFASEKIS